VVFETAQGIEALRCSGLPETFSFARVPAGLSSTPTLSVLTRTRREITATITLSYLAEGFDWAANYVATLAPDGQTLHLGAWITLANGNGVGLPQASTQTVAGRLNRRGDSQAPPNDQTAIIARCWPQGTTSDELAPEGIELVRPPTVASSNIPAPPPLYIKAVAAPAPAAPLPPPEQLGDLKLYRVPQTTTVAARQSKQVRLLDQADVPVTKLWSADLPVTGAMPFGPTATLLRTKNDLAHHLGLPLPSGQVAVFSLAKGRLLLTAETPLRDTATDEDVELRLGDSPDVQVKQTRLSFNANAPEVTPLTPELALAYQSGRAIEEVEITSARGEPTPFELRLVTYGGLHVTDADQSMGLKDGRPIFRLTLPAHGAVKVRYAVADH
jgi:hypothetical protein